MATGRVHHAAELTTAFVVKHKLAPVPWGCWIVANAIARRNGRRKTKRIVGHAVGHACLSAIAQAGLLLASQSSRPLARAWAE